MEGWSARAAARRFGLARETVRKMLRYRLPPGYRRQKPIRCPKLEAFTGVIDQILRDDQHRPKKQRHTAKRICERLREEHDFTGGYTIVKAYVREQKLGGQEMFVPLAHPFVPLCPASQDFWSQPRALEEVERQDPFEGRAVERGGPVPVAVGQGFKAAEAGGGEAAFDTAALAVLEFGGDDALEEHGGTPAPLGGLGDEIVEVVGGARPVEPAQVTRQGRRGRVG